MIQYRDFAALVLDQLAPQARAAREFPAKARRVYPQGGSGLLDSTRVNFKLDPAPFLRELAINAILEHWYTMTDGPLVIPPNQIKTFHNQYQIPALFPATISTIGPHAHLLCSRMRSYAVLPNNEPRA